MDSDRTKYQALNCNAPVEAVEQHERITFLLLLERPDAAAQYRGLGEAGLKIGLVQTSEHYNHSTKFEQGAGRNRLAWTGTRSIRLARRMASPSRMRSTAEGRNDGKPVLAPPPRTPADAASAEAATLTQALDDAAGRGGSAAEAEEESSIGIGLNLLAAPARAPAPLCSRWSVCSALPLRLSGCYRARGTVVEAAWQLAAATSSSRRPRSSRVVQCYGTCDVF